MSDNIFSLVAQHVNRVDPDQFDNIMNLLDTTNLITIGKYIAESDPDMAKRILKGDN